MEKENKLRKDNMETIYSPNCIILHWEKEVVYKINGGRTMVVAIHLGNYFEIEFLHYPIHKISIPDGLKF